MINETLNEFARLSKDVQEILIRLMERIKKENKPSENSIANNTLK